MNETLEMIVFANNDIKTVNVKEKEFVEYFNTFKKGYSRNGYCFEYIGIYDYDKFCSYLVKKSLKKNSNVFDSGCDAVNDFLNIELYLMRCKIDYVRLYISLNAASRCYNKTGKSSKILLIGKYLDENYATFKKFGYKFFQGRFVEGIRWMADKLSRDEETAYLLYYMESMLANGKATKRFVKIFKTVKKSYEIMLDNVKDSVPNDYEKYSRIKSKIKDIEKDLFNIQQN